MSLSPGTRFGRFELLSILGTGGMGSVYRARDTRLGRVVALKVLHASDEKARADVLREARAAARIDHPNAVSVFDADEVDGVPYIEMELIEGVTLRTMVGRADVALSVKIAWLVAIARALGAAHRSGVVHRDLKPENVMLREDGIIKVLDFGIASRVTEVDRTAETGTLEEGPKTTDPTTVGTTYGTRVRGTPAYCAPEQLRGERLDGRADQFSWGVMAYELVTGERPWTASGMVELVEQVVAGAVDVGRMVEAGGTEAFGAVVARAMEKSAAGRFGSMEAAIEALEGFGVGDGNRRSKEDERSLRALYIASLGLAILVMAGAALQAGRQARIRPQAATRAVSQDGTTNAVARARFRDGMTMLREGSLDAAECFKAAVAADPTFASAQLQLLALIGEGSPSGRAQLQVVRGFRSALNEEERALLDSMEPLAEMPENLREMEHRLESHLERIPDSVMLLVQLGRARFNRGHYLDAIAAFDHALRIDPGYGVAAAEREHSFLFLDDVAVARSVAEACVASFPASASCLGDLFAYYRSDGDCAAAAEIGRRLVSLAPTPGWHWLLANALYDEGRGLSAAMAELDRVVETSDEEHREDARLRGLAAVASLSGDFVAAGRYTREREAALSTNHNSWLHTRPLMMAMNIALESGDSPQASSLASTFLQKLPGWLDFEPSMSMYALRGLYWSDKISRDEYVRRRDAWVAKDLATQSRDGTTDGMSWIIAYALPLRTRKDAEDALATLGHYVIPNRVNRGPHNEAAIGEMYRLLGDLPHALTALGGGAGSCEALWFPFEYGWANLHLAQAREQAGDTAGACEAYAKVLKIWGAAKPRSVSADTARRRVSALGCSRVDAGR